MKCRTYKPEDYATVKAWWEKHGSAAVSSALLPPCGIVAMDKDGTPAAAVWLYQANDVGVAWLAWLTTNPDLPAKVAAQALEAVLGGAEAVALEFNYGVLFTMTDKPSLIRWLKERDFVANHSGATQLFKSLR